MTSLPNYSVAQTCRMHQVRTDLSKCLKTQGKSPISTLNFFSMNLRLFWLIFKHCESEEFFLPLALDFQTHKIEKVFFLGTKAREKKDIGKLTSSSSNSLTKVALVGISDTIL